MAKLSLFLDLGDFFDHDRENLVDVSDDADIGDFEDRCVFILVDGYNVVRTGDAGKMLCST